MATFYLDFEGGNDSNDGLSFANRWKTLTSGATAARIAPGDTIRMMKSPDPVSLGVTGTFVKASPIVTLSSSVTMMIDAGETSWIPSANVTASTNGIRKHGNLSATLAIATAFTTGLIGYKATGLLDLSSYQNISLWLRSTGSMAANTFRVDLCSDTAGATPVHSFTINTALASAAWRPLTFKNGAALSSSIQSVAIRALTDPGSTTLFIDGIIACNDLHYNALVGTSSSATSRYWYPVRSIDGTTLELDCSQSALKGTTSARGWAEEGTTTTVYARDTIELAATQTMNDSGDPVAGLITFSGGWDRTDMSTQDGMTFCGISALTTSSGFQASGSYIKITRTAFLWGGNAFNYTGTFTTLEDCGHYGATGHIALVDGFYINYTAGSNNGTGLTLSQPCIVKNLIVYSSVSSGLQCSSGHSFVDDLTCKTSGAQQVAVSAAVTGTNWQLYDGASSAIVVTGYLELTKLATSGHTNNVSISNSGLVRLQNYSVAESIVISSSRNVGLRAQISADGTYAGSVWSPQLNIYDTTTGSLVHAPATRSWVHSPQNFHSSVHPIRQRLQPFPVNGSGLVTFKIWVRRRGSGMAARLVLEANITPGVTADVTADATAGVDVWEQLTVTCTPTSAGFVQVELLSWTTDGTTTSVLWSDATVTQA